MKDPYIEATVTATDRPGEYHLAGGTTDDEFYFRGSLDVIELFALDLLAQIKTLRGSA